MAFVVYEGHHPQEKEDPGFERSQKSRKWAEQVLGWLKQGFDAATPSCNFVAFVVYEIRTPSTRRRKERSQKNRKWVGQVFGWLKQALTLPILPC